jgi:predicted HicB family RNase H-like nuclease
MLTPENRRGRPSLEPGMKSRTWPVRVGPSLDDKAAQIAIRRGVSVPAVIRRALERYDPDDDDEY